MQEDILRYLCLIFGVGIFVKAFLNVSIGRFIQVLTFIPMVILLLFLFGHDFNNWNKEQEKNEQQRINSQLDEDDPQGYHSDDYDDADKGTEWIDSYEKDDGTQVDGYERDIPDGNPDDNLGNR
ncbi:hypothetical protein V7089_18405 [Neobacillus drentensis]